jgi:hypothetical protein
MVIICISCFLALFAGCGSTDVQTEEVIQQQAEVSEEEAAEPTSEPAVTPEPTPVKEEVKEVTDSGAKATEAAEATPEVDEFGLSTDIDSSKIINFEESKTLYAQTNVNMRTGPSTDYESVGNIKTNTEVKVIGRYGQDGWYLIDLKDKKAFVSNNYLGEEQIDLEALRAEQEAAAMEAIKQQQAAQQAQPQQEQNTQQQAQAPAPAPAMPPAGILFIGDSRCVQMREAVGGGNSSWICENSKGYQWLVDKAIGQADECVGKGTKVVICLGVNDTENCNKYAELINAKAAEWAGRGAKTYFVSVNPVTENPYRTEPEVENFNASIVGQLSGVRWIDTHSVLVNNGYRMVDGLHYDADTYVLIFNLIVGSLK